MARFVGESGSQPRLCSRDERRGCKPLPRPSLTALRVNDGLGVTQQLEMRTQGPRQSTARPYWQRLSIRFK
jgi:hypothetical protein